MSKKSLINKTDKIFVAGHKGMVGKSVIRKLRENSYNNVLVESKENLDLLNFELVNKWFFKNKPDVVIISAAKVGGISANNNYPVEFLLNNLKIQNNLIESAWKTGSKRLLFLGSSCIYPKFAKQPIKEEELLSGSLENTNQWYAIAKISGIKLCEALRTQYNFDAISLMPTNLYGPGDNYSYSNSHVLPALIRKFWEAKKNHSKSVTCWGTGLPRREFLHVDDLSEAIIYALNNWDPSLLNSPRDSNNEALNFLNVGTGKDISIKELSNLIANEVGFKGEINWDSSKPDGTPRKQLDISRILKLGWKPKINLVDGIKESILNFEKELQENSLRI